MESLQILNETPLPPIEVKISKSIPELSYASHNDDVIWSQYLYSTNLAEIFKPPSVRSKYKKGAIIWSSDTPLL